KAILDEQSELVSLAAPDGTITYVNPSYARHFGLTESQLIGTNLFDHVLPADRQEVRDKIARVMETGVPVVNENRMLVPQGTECWVAWTNRLQRGPHGEPLLHSVGRDVTERKQLEDALRELTTIFDNTTDYVIQTGLRGNITYLNPAARAVLGIAPDAPVTSMRFSDFNTPETNERLAKVIIPAVNEKGIWLGETVFHAGDGRPLPVSHMVIGHRDKQGRVTRYSGIMRDITQELASKREQQRQAATLRAITEAIPGFVAVIDTDRRYRFVNSGFERWVGQPRGQIIGKTVAEVLGPVNYAASLPWMERALAGESVSFERVHEGHAVTRHLAMSYIPMFGEDGRVEGFIGVGQDITEHRQEEGRLLELSQRDPLTGLLNRSGFEQFLERLAHDPLAHQGVALLYLDLDHFKPVNDTHGHRVGDQLLQQFAERLQGTVRPSDAVARLGGDEFAIVLVGMRDPAHADAVADKVVSAARAPFTVGELTLHIGASVGVAFGDVGPAGWRELLERADTRLYQAKAEGRGRYAV
ncbi:MAG TPA: PAS domain-containing protein, partial [Rhizobacter sp.]|nr:PAS domain-containing protein [Rhizobacter sp.]